MKATICFADESNEVNVLFDWEDSVTLPEYRYRARREKCAMLSNLLEFSFAPLEEVRGSLKQERSVEAQTTGA